MRRVRLAYVIAVGASVVIATATVAGAQRADTASTKAWLLAADRALAASVAEKGIAALVDALAPDAAVLVPEQPILRGRDAEGPLVARYGAPSRIGWRPLAAVASLDPSFGCTVGVAWFVSAADTSHRERGGDYLFCWRRSANGVARLVGMQRGDAGPTVPPASADFDGGVMPHSATQSGEPRALAAAQDADAKFAKAGGTAAGPGESFAHWVAVDGLFPGEASATRGPALMRAAFANAPSGVRLVWGPTRAMGQGAGGLAFTVGDAERRNAETGAVLSKTKYFTVWRLDDDGRWRWIFDLGSPRQ